jgi:hypothetical protein
MLLAKTEKAKLMLSQRDPSLGAKGRQILIMCNGARSYNDLVEMLGRDAMPILDQFIKNRLLMDTSQALKSNSGIFSPTGTFYSSDFANSGTGKAASLSGKVPLAPLSNHAPLSSMSAPLSTDRAALTASQDKPVSTNSKGKRSIAASKMYMINLLQMHRDLDSSTLAVNIHTSEDEQQLVACILASLRFVTHKAGLQYGQRVTEQLRNILPESYLPDLDAFNNEVLLHQPPFVVTEN